MKEHISAYIKELNALYQTGLTTEHSFRPALQRLLSACTGFTVINGKVSRKYFEEQFYGMAEANQKGA